jgi:hypothetical protein
MKDLEDVAPKELVPTAPMALTDRQVIDRLVEGLKANTLVLDMDDAMTLAEAESLTITDAEDYRRGFELLAGLRDVDDKVEAHYGKFKDPLRELTNTIRDIKNPQTQQVASLKQALSDRLTTWKQAEDRRIAEVLAERQRVADKEAQDKREAAAKELEEAAATVPVELAEVMRIEAEMVRSTPTGAAPVTLDVESPKGTRAVWKGKIDDVQALLKAHVDGKIHLPIDAIADALQSWVNTEAKSHKQHLSRVYPGVSSYKDETPITPRRRR